MEFRRASVHHHHRSESTEFKGTRIDMANMYCGHNNNIARQQLCVTVRGRVQITAVCAVYLAMRSVINSALLSLFIYYFHCVYLCEH